MGRPRLHDQGAILDAAEELVAHTPEALTIRSLAARTGAPSGSLYHAFGSRSALLGTMWLRAARLFLARQRQAVDKALSAPGDADTNAVQATIAAAMTIADLRKDRPNTAGLLTTHRRERLLEEELPKPLAADLQALDRELRGLLRTLAQALWGRTDRPAIETVAVCVVDLPSALLFDRRPMQLDPQRLLETAITAILQHPPPQAP